MSYTIKISQDDNDRRLDRILRGMFKHITLGEIMKSIRKGEVRVNSKRVKEPGTKIFAGDELVVKWPPENENNEKENEKKIFAHNSWGKIKILFQGENVLILNKPAGILVQPDEPGGDSVISRVWAMTGSKTPAAVHRLDRNTTGVLAVALHGEALRALEELFKNRSVRKFYLAVVTGQAPEEIIIDAPLLKDSENNLVKVSDEGLTAVTKCERIATDGKFSLVKLELLTGRTHQARVHMAHIKHPILGDRKYGDFRINRLMKKITRPLLHAYELEFPDNLRPALSEIEDKTFSAPLPDDMKEFLNELGIRSEELGVRHES
ncbi:MAG: RluA family pseudouridine synthase [Synergistaceae bacterium]|nr:RluA family pseudouridine synthase [Synergistaceae bacterium]